MERDTHRLQVTLTESLYQTLKATAEMQNISMSAAVNVAVTEYCRKVQRENQSDSSNSKSK